MKKKFWNSDKIFGLTAVVISLVTLIIFVRQTNIMDKQSRLSVMPYLMIEVSNRGDEKSFSFELTNHGVGPAIIDSTSNFYKGKPYNMQFIDFLKTNFKEMDSIDIINIAPLNRGLAIPAGGSRNILTVGGNEEDHQAFAPILQELMGDDFDYEIYYRSIYDDRWKITSSNEIPQEIK